MSGADQLSQLAAFMLTWLSTHPDVELLQPTCPGCGAVGDGLAHPNIAPMFWCLRDGCDVLTWDPATPARPQLAQAHIAAELDLGPDA